MSSKIEERSRPLFAARPGQIIWNVSQKKKWIRLILFLARSEQAIWNVSQKNFKSPETDSPEEPKLQPGNPEYAKKPIVICIRTCNVNQKAGRAGHKIAWSGQRAIPDTANSLLWSTFTPANAIKNPMKQAVGLPVRRQCKSKEKNAGLCDLYLRWQSESKSWKTEEQDWQA